jgi:hypothetical protein
MTWRCGARYKAANARCRNTRTSGGATMTIPNSVRDWLLESPDPSIRYRTASELLDLPLSQEEIATYRSAIANSAPVGKLLGAMHPDGYWLHRKKGTTEYVGAGVEYLGAATTHYCLAYLSELGVGREHPAIEKAAQRYLGLQALDGDWYLHLSCLLGYNIKTFIGLGYRDDERVRKSVALLLESCRHDGGYLCDIHEKKTGKKKKSCIRGSVKALEAFAELGETYWSHPSCTGLVGYFLDRDGIFKSTDTQQPVNKDVQILSFPFLWNAGLLQILYSLSRMGYGNDTRLARAWALLECKKDDSGRYPLDWTPTQCPWKVGKAGMANAWVTLYAYLALKYRNGRNHEASNVDRGDGAFGNGAFVHARRGANQRDVQPGGT